MLPNSARRDVTLYHELAFWFSSSVRPSITSVRERFNWQATSWKKMRIALRRNKRAFLCQIRVLELEQALSNPASTHSVPHDQTFDLAPRDTKHHCSSPKNQQVRLMPTQSTAICLFYIYLIWQVERSRLCRSLRRQLDQYLRVKNQVSVSFASTYLSHRTP